ncbi:MAG: leucine-rich repeat protein [Clostridia bacterium]|nr:leucine-rich repeat protein [Clostridia bacterium]
MKKLTKRISVLALAGLMTVSSSTGIFLQSAKVNANASNLSENVTSGAAENLLSRKEYDVGFEKADGIDVSQLFIDNYNPEVVLTNKLSPAKDYVAVINLGKGSILEEANAKELTVAEYSKTAAGKALRASISKEIDGFLKEVKALGIEAETVYRYDTLTKGVAIRAKGCNFDKIAAIEGVESVIMSEHYDAPKVLEISNDTNVYATGIYNTSEIDKALRGNGTAIAVLDTGTDVQHPAFQTENFEATQFALTREKIAEKLQYTKAAEFDKEASIENVYKSSKLPFAFDYADKDSNVYPAYSSHGLHVAGIIAGNYTEVDEATVNSDPDLMFEYDEEKGTHYFEGVVPDAQIVTMKVFTDNVDDEALGGAETENILAALEDAVTIGVDVINMSLGSSAGFSSYVDDYMEKVYTAIEDAGISLVCAASNDYSAGYGGENGTNLTSDPDAATVGSPSTYHAAISVASINGQKDPYMLAQDEIMVFFTEATDGNSNKMDFVGDIFQKLKADGNMPAASETTELQYVVIPGLGRSYNYSANIRSKLQSQPSIALVQRGTTTFEEKMKIAKENGAIGIMIYNNVAGKISMTMGAKNKSDIIPSCSISMDVGNQMVLAAQDSVGKIVLNKAFLSGPFMSDFSSWGPTPSLELKPEITAYGGNVTSSVAGGYDVYSGTSMATPNMAGAVAIIRTHLKNTYPDMSAQAIAKRTYQLMMSTAGIVLNEYGDPYSPRKQGAGIANIEAALASQSYISVLDKDGVESSKTKIELGDDPNRTGVYEFEFTVNNVSSEYARYELGWYVMTETVSSDGKTVAEKSNLLKDASVKFWVNGKATTQKQIMIGGNSTAQVKLQISLSEENKAFLNENFKNGMFVEGFATLKQTATGVQDGKLHDLTLPFLAFYGDWTDAPMLDYSMFEIAENEADDSIPDDEKYEIKFFATTPYSKYGEEYILPMGMYLYNLPDDADPIYSSEEKASLSIYHEEFHETAYEFYAVYAGLMRGMAVCEVQIVNEYTGEVVWQETKKNVSKGYANGGSARPGFIEVEFNPYELNLPNNTKYRFSMVGYLDYGDGQQGNKNSFSFSFTTDYEKPTLSDVNLRYEEYKDEKEETQTRVYLDITTYDNNYAQSILLCYVDTTNTIQLLTDYITPVYSTRKGQTVTTSIEITDYYEEYFDTMYLQVEDYAMNYELYALALDEAIVFPERLSFAQDELHLSLHGSAKPEVTVLPSNAQRYDLVWTSNDEDVAIVQDGEIYATGVGETYITVYATRDDVLLKPSARIKVIVTDETVEVPKYKSLEFGLLKDKREAVVNPTNRTVEVHPNKEFALTIVSKPFYLPTMQVTWKSSNPYIATVDENGIVHTLREGSCTITAQQVNEDGSLGFLSANTYLNVGPEFVIESYILEEYHGAGGDVVVPEELNFMYIDKECFKDNQTITSFVVPDDVMEIWEEAFYGCTALEYVSFPKSLTLVQESAFENCKALKTVDMTDALSVIFSHRAFYGCTALEEIVNDERLTAIWNYTFANCSSLKSLNISNLVQVGEYAFSGCTGLEDIVVSKYTVIGEGMFYGCSGLKEVTLPAEYIGENAFYACKNLEKVVLNGNTIVGESAFRGCISLRHLFMTGRVYEIRERAFEGCTAMRILVLPNCEVEIGKNAFYRCDGLMTVGVREQTLLNFGEAFRSCDTLKNIGYATITYSEENGYANEFQPSVTETEHYEIIDNVVYNKEGTELVFVPTMTAEISLSATLEKIGAGAFYGKSLLTSVTLPANLKEIGDYAFSYTGIESIEIPASVEKIGEGAFSYCYSLSNVTFAENSTLSEIPEGCFNSDYALEKIAIPKTVTVIGDYAFGASALSEIYAVGGTAKANTFNGEDLAVTDIGDGAFSGCKVGKAILPATLETLGMNAFAINPLLTEVYFRSNVKMGDAVFFDSTNLEKVEFFDEMTSIGDYTFASTAGQHSLRYVTLPSELTGIGAYAFSNCFNLETLSLPDGVAYVGDYAFYGCSSLQDLKMENVTYVGNYAFTGTQAFKEVNLPVALVIGDYAFYQSNLKTISIPSVVHIGDGGIAYTRLEWLDLPASLETLGNGAFHYNFYLDGIRIEDNGRFFIDPLTDDGYGVLYSYRASGKYQTEAYPGGNPARAYTILEGTERIGEMAFTGANTLYSIYAPNSLKTIGDKAFYDCGAMDYNFLSVNAPNLEARYIDGGLYEPDSWMYEVFSRDGQYADERFYANFYYYAMFLYYGYYPYGTSYGLMLTYPQNGVGYDEFIWSCFFQDIYYTEDTIDETTLAAIEAVKLLPALDEINGLIGAADQETASLRAEEITELLKTARSLYNNIVSDTQLAFFNGEYDGVDYFDLLSQKEAAMRPVKDHFCIVTTVVSLTLISTPDKMTYVEGEAIDTTGMVVQATYDDGTMAIVEDYELSTYVATLTGGRITVSFGGQSTSFRITVKAAGTPDTPDDNPDTPGGNPDDSTPPDSSDSSSDSSVEENQRPSGGVGCKGAGCNSVVGVGAPAFAIGAAMIVLLKRRKGEDE